MSKTRAPRVGGAYPTNDRSTSYPADSGDLTRRHASTDTLPLLKLRKTALPKIIACLVDPIALIPMGRLAKIDEVAATVAFIASDEARFSTGQLLSVNGGSSML